MSDLEQRLAEAEAQLQLIEQIAAAEEKLRVIEDARHQVTAVLCQLRLCHRLESLIADPDFPHEFIPWTPTVKLTPEQFGRVLPLLIELQKLLKG